MQNKLALVTGASKGIGLAIAKKLLQENWTVVGIARTFPAVPSGNFVPYPLDMENLKELPKHLKALKEQYPSVDAIIGNAGKGHFGSLEELSFEQIQSLIHLNFLSQVYLIKTFIPSFKRLEKGHIVLMGSEAALQGKKMGSIYCASKFALRGFAQALREECSSHHIRVSLINPGMVQTDFFEHLSFSPGQHPSEHILPEDIAETVSLVLNMRDGTVLDEISLSPQRKLVQFKSHKQSN
jgi:NADP-dependent 3-hydroxy acid dehydrogenase YdfG